MRHIWISGFIYEVGFNTKYSKSITLMGGLLVSCNKDKKLNYEYEVSRDASQTDYW